jgi:ketosteroid isomerase-like protein
MSALRLVAELHRRQREMYSGGSVEPVLDLLAEDIVWHVPGETPISGDHRGMAQVIEYFEKRTGLTKATTRMRTGEAIFEGEAVAQFIDVSAVLDGRKVSWQTIGVYRIDLEQSRIREVWLVPLDLATFNLIFSASD